MKIGSRTGCHQLYERSFTIKGYQFPVCARCTGLFAGYISGLILSVILLRYNFHCNILYCLGFAVFFTALLGIDGIGQLKGKWSSNNKRRFITGLLCGAGVISFFIIGAAALKEAFKETF